MDWKRTDLDKKKRSGFDKSFLSMTSDQSIEYRLKKENFPNILFPLERLRTIWKTKILIKNVKVLKSIIGLHKQWSMLFNSDEWIAI